MSRDIANETTQEVTGRGPAVSSHKALNFNLVSPYMIIRLAKRLSDGATKYGSYQWRQGINDAEYITDRFNHTFQHMLNFMIDGNTKDDNLGAMLWGIHCLMEVERLSPDSLNKIIGNTDIYGEYATIMHELEMKERNA
jgi:hypothetical protein